MLSNASGPMSSRAHPPEPSTSTESSEQSTSSVEEAEAWLKSHYDSPRFVAIIWGDAFCKGDASWTEAEDLYEAAQQEPSKILTSGVLVRETVSTLCVMSTIIEDGQAGGQIHVIPKGWIISRKDLA
jgi:hypothetical protein